MPAIKAGRKGLLRFVRLRVTPEYAGPTELIRWPEPGGYGAVMPMTTSLPLDCADKVRFAISPLLEFGAAWHVLAGPEHHPERAEWVRRVPNCRQAR